ncbi:hypothetical protein Tco_0824191 [Tanacetum coccineum]|uniref:Uncharacterized protein n=1 Tax=Tanacetum coccineum TaxID=301880 RepID=A0ABQ5AN27_9ASTR
MYNKKTLIMPYLLWEDFIARLRKRYDEGSAMYYPRFTKLVVNYVMEKDPSIPRRNKVNWHYARDDPMFTTINVISRNEATQLMALSIAGSDCFAMIANWWLLPDRLKIGKCNTSLRSDITSKEATLQVVYDVLKLTPVLQGFPVTAVLQETI